MLNTLFNFLKRPVSGYGDPTPAELQPWYAVERDFPNIQPGVPLRMQYYNRTMNNTLAIVPNGNASRQV
jgi:hypothetical protein